MFTRIEEIQKAVESFEIKSKADIEEFKRLFTAKKGSISELMEKLKEVPKEEKAQVGKSINDLKQFALEKLEQFQSLLESKPQENLVDVSLPGLPFYSGSRHPLSLVTEEIIQIFQSIGFQIADGPEVEDDWHNFSALNFAENHPARDMQDTFFAEQEGYLLRTHTSSVQVRLMETTKPPLRVLMPGRVYRNEAISARAHCFFHQIEGLYIAEHVSFADLRQTLLYFSRKLFGDDVKIRLRPSYFPFTEISAEMDISCQVCGGSGCQLCKHSGWVEILGCGMVDPNVLTNCGIDAEKYSGFAFGMGVERIAQLKFRVPDLRLYSQNDYRFLEQFQKFA